MPLTTRLVDDTKDESGPAGNYAQGFPPTRQWPGVVAESFADRVFDSERRS
ncbi:hypothetical protein [Amycolatopsis alba]|uniref:hypothetical protein n=1 Tax=Amycolatopsis alba TaxID=76020 RepID=UPI0003777C69|nr:hypothetical protein [Amycolatopsis alba]